MEDEVRKAVRDKLVAKHITGDGPIHAFGLKNAQVILVYHHHDVSDELRQELADEANPYVLEYVPADQPSMG